MGCVALVPSCPQSSSVASSQLTLLYHRALFVPGQKSCCSCLLAEVWSSFRGRLGQGLTVALIQLGAALGPGACPAPLLTLSITCLVLTGLSLSQPDTTDCHSPEQFIVFLSFVQKCLGVGPGVSAEVTAPAQGVVRTLRSCSDVSCPSATSKTPWNFTSEEGKYQPTPSPRPGAAQSHQPQCQVPWSHCSSCRQLWHHELLHLHAQQAPGIKWAPILSSGFIRLINTADALC